MALSTNIYAEVTTTFPASVTGAGGITVTKSGGVYTVTWSGSAIAVNSIGNDKLAKVTAAHLLGNPTGAQADRSEISLGSDLEFSGTLLRGAALIGDVTKSAGSTTTAISAGAVGTAEIATDAVTADEIAAGAVGSSEIATGAVGSDEIATDAVGADEIAANAVGASELANDAVDTDAVLDDAVTYAKIQNMTTNRLLGRGTASVGIIEEIVLGTNLSLSGTTLNAASGAASLPRYYLSGLGLANNSTDANNDIDIAVGECRDGADSEDMVLASILVKRLDASWTVGTNQGGLDTGSETTSIWYFVWLIKRTDTGVVDVLFSASATAPTMPTSYDKKRRIGAIFNDGSLSITPFIQDGDWFIWKDPITDVNVSNFGTSATLYTLSVPTLINAIACANFRVFQSVSATTALFTGPDETDATPTSARFDILTVGGFDSGNVYRHVRTNTSAQVRARSTTANNTLTIITRGYIDLRGREE